MPTQKPTGAQIAATIDAELKVPGTESFAFLSSNPGRSVDVRALAHDKITDPFSTRRKREDDIKWNDFQKQLKIEEEKEKALRLEADEKTLSFALEELNSINESFNFPRNKKGEIDLDKIEVDTLLAYVESHDAVAKKYNLADNTAYSNMMDRKEQIDFVLQALDINEAQKILNMPEEHRAVTMDAVKDFSHPAMGFVAEVFPLQSIVETILRGVSGVTVLMAGTDPDGTLKKERDEIVQKIRALELPVTMGTYVQTKTALEYLQEYRKNNNFETGMTPQENQRLKVAERKLKNTLRRTSLIVAGKAEATPRAYYDNILGRILPTAENSSPLNFLIDGYNETFYNAGRIYEKEYLEPYLERTGKTEKQLTPEDAKNIWSGIKDIDKLLIEAQVLKSAVDGQIDTLGSFWYKSLEGAGHSVDMMAGIALGGYAGRGISIGARAATAGTRLGASLSALSAVRTSQRLFSLYGGPSLQIGGALRNRIITGSVQASYWTGRMAYQTALATAANPMFIAERMNRQGFSEIRDPETGEYAGYITTSAFKTHLIGELHKQKEQYEELYKELSKKSTLTEEEEALLEEVLVFLGQVKERKQESFAAQLEFYESQEAESLFSQITKGYLTTGAERISELYGARMVKYPFRKLGQGADWIGRGIGGKTYASLRTGASAVGDRIGGYYKYLNHKTAVGRAYNRVMTGAKNLTSVDGMRIFNGIPEEILEEIPAELFQAIIDWDIKEAKPLLTTEFYIDVAAQTLIIGATFGLGGGAKASSGRAIDYFQSRNLEKQRKTLENLQNQINNETDSSKKERLQKEFKEKQAAFLKEEKKVEGSWSRGIANTHRKRQTLAEVIRELESGEVSQETLDFVADLAPGVRNTQETFDKIKELRRKGEHKKANLLEQKAMSTLIDMAINTNSLYDLRTSLETAIANQSLGDPKENSLSYRNATRTMEALKVAEDFINSNKDNPRAHVGAKLLAQRKLQGFMIQDFETEGRKGAQEDSVREEVQSFIDMIPGATLTVDDVLANLENLDALDTTEIFNAQLVEQIKNQASNLFSSVGGVLKSFAQARNIKQSRADTIASFNEIMNPSADVAFSERFNVAYNKAREKKIREKLKVNKEADNFLSQDEVTQLLGEVEAQQGKDWKKVSKEYKGVVESRARALEGALQEKKKRLQEKLAVLAKLQAEWEAQQQEGVEIEETATDSLEQQAVEELLSDLRDEIVRGEEEGQNIDEAISLVDSSSELDPETLAQIKESLKKLLGFIGHATGMREVTFEFIVRTIVAFEPNAGEIVYGAGRLKYFIKAFEDLGGTFEKGEVEKITLLPRSEVDGASPSALFEYMREEYLKQNPFNIRITPETLSPVELGNKKKEKEKQQEEPKDAPPVGVTTLPYTAEARTTLKAKEGLPPRLGFSTIGYENYVDEKGQVQRRSIRTDKMEHEREPRVPGEIIIDPRPLLHPDNSDFDLEIEVSDPSDWDKIVVAVEIINEQGDKRFTTFAQWVAQKKAEDPNFENTEEFRKKIPIFAKKGNTRVAYIHDQDWFNPFNIKNPVEYKEGVFINPSEYRKEPVWVDHIAKAAKRNWELRKAILEAKEPVTKLRYKQPKEAKWQFTNELMSLIEANPQVEIVVQKGTTMQDFIQNNLHKDFKEGKKILLNKPEDFSSDTVAHTWAIHRAGTKHLPDGTKIPTYWAVAVGRRITGAQNEAEVSSFLWATAAFQAIHGFAVPHKTFQMTKEQAQELALSLRRQTGFDITTPAGLTEYLSTFHKLTFPANQRVKEKIHTKKKEVEAALKGRTLGSEAVSLIGYILTFENALKQKTPDEVYNFLYSNLEQNTNLASLRSKKKIAHFSKNGEVKMDGREYRQYLLESLTTNVKAYNMGTKSSPAYTIAVQPILEIEDNFENVEYEEKSETKPVQSVTPAQVETEVQEVAEKQEESKGEAAQEVKEALTEKDKEIADFLMNTINLDLDQFLEGDDAIPNIEKFLEMFQTTAGLSGTKLDAFVSFIASTLVKGANFREKLSNKSIQELRKLAFARLQEHSDKIVKQAKEHLTYLKSIENPTVQQQLLMKGLEDTLITFGTAIRNFEDLFVAAFEAVNEETRVDFSEYESEVEVSDNVQQIEKNYSKESIEESPKSRATAKLKMLLSGIPVYDNDNNIVLGYGGIPVYMTLDEAYNLVLKTISAKTDPVPSFDALIEILQESEHPAIKEVIARLQNSDKQLQNQFVVNSSLHSLTSRFAMYEFIPNEGVKLKFYDTNSSTVKDSVLRNWKDQHITSGLYDSEGNFDTALARQLIDEFKAMPEKFEDVSLTSLRQWIEKLGIELHPRTWENILVNGIPSGKATYSLKGMYESNTGASLFRTIVQTLEAGINAPENYGVNGINIFDNLVGLFNGLAQTEAYYNPELISLVFRDSGKTISTIVPPKYMTDLVASLKRDAEGPQALIEEILKIPYSSRSVILDMLEKHQEFRDYFKLHHISLTSLKERNEKNRKKDKKAPTLDKIEYFVLSLTAFQDRRTAKFSKDSGANINGFKVRMANMISPTMSDKDTVVAMSTVVLDLLNDSHAFYRDETDTLRMSEDLKTTLYELIVEPQLKRIIDFHENKRVTNVKSYDVAAGFFMDTPIFNTIQIDGMNLVKYLYTMAGSVSQESLISKVKGALTEALAEVIYAEADKTFKLFMKKGVEADPTTGVKENLIFDLDYFRETEQYKKVNNKTVVDHFDAGVLDFVINTMLFNSEMNKIFIGDTAQYFKVQKPLPQGEAKYDMTPAEFAEMSKETGVNLGKRLALLIAPGRRVAESTNTTYNQIFLKDPSDIAENMVQLVQWYYPDMAEEKSKLINKYREKRKALKVLQETKVAPSKLQNRQNKIDKLSGELKNIIKKIEKDMPDIAGYLSLESTDAQEYTTVQEHLNLLYQYGRMPEEDYKRLTAINQRGEDFSPADLRKFVLQPMKPVHTGIYNDSAQGLRRMVYIKSSSYPLVPQLTRGSSLDGLRTAMERLEKETGRPTRASYQSANKVGATVNAINPLDVHSLEQMFTDSTVGNSSPTTTVLVLSRDNFRIQQDTPYKSGKKQVDKASLGTQIFKLLFGDGIMNVEGKVFPFKGQMLTAQELYEKFSDSFGTIIEVKKQELFDELGLDESGIIKDEETFVRKLQNLLLREAKERKYDTKSLRGLGMRKYVRDGKEYWDFETPLWLSSDSNKYEALLNSIVTNRIMQHKLPGNGYIAASESGFSFSENFDSVKEKSKIIYLEGWNGEELQATKNKEGKISRVQVMVEAKFKNHKGELIDLFEGYKPGDISKAKYLKMNENGTLGLKEGMIDPELFNLFTFRIPTSSHVSASSVEIVGLLPPGSGDLMLVPKNFTKQKGLDFDIDKETAYALNHYVTETGKIVNYSKVDKEFVKEEINEFFVENMSGKHLQDVLLNNPYIIQALQRAYKKEKIASVELVYVVTALQKQLIYEEKKAQGKDLSNTGVFSREQVAAMMSAITGTEHQETSIQDLKNDIAKYTAQLFGANPGKEAELTRIIAEAVADKDTLKLVRREIGKQIAGKIYRKAAHQEQLKKAENDFILAHLGVYNSPSDEVQRKINKILSMDYTRGEAERLEALREKGARNAEITELMRAESMTYAEAEKQLGESGQYFTILSPHYQKDKMDLGSIGKTAIGIYAVATTFNGLIQQRFPNGYAVESFRIGQFVSNSLGAVKTINSEFTTAEFFAEKENTATDNEKEQILGRVGINDATIGTDAYGTLRGFGKGEKGNAILYDLVSQPAVVEFNRIIRESKGLLGSYVNQEDLLNLMVSSMTGGKMTYELFPVSETRFEMMFLWEGTPMREKGSKLLTAEAMEDGIARGIAEGEIQAHALKTFYELKEEADRMVGVMSSLNENSLGKSTIETNLKKQRLSKALTRSELLQELIGDIVDIETPGSFPFMYFNGVELVPMGIMPKTPQGRIAVEGLLIHSNTFDKYFPYSRRPFQSVIKTILDIKGVNEDFVTAEMIEDIADEVKRYLFSSQDNGVFRGNPEAIRYELFVDDSQNTSLSTYLSKVLRDKSEEYASGINAIKKNALVGKRLKMIPGKSEKDVSRIEFNNAGTEQINDKTLYEALPRLIVANKPLPPRNGRPYTTRDLAQDLVAYSFLEGGIQEANQFLKYIPVELLSSMGQGVGSNFRSINQKLQRFNRPGEIDHLAAILYQKEEGYDVGNFVIQYFQNNPKEAPSFYYKNVKYNEDTNMLQVKESSDREYNAPIYKMKVKGAVKLFVRVGEGSFMEVPVADTRYISQYNPNATMVTPVQSLKKAPVKPRYPVPTKEGINFSGAKTVKEGLEVVLYSNSTTEKQAALARHFLNYFAEQEKLGERDGLGAVAISTGDIFLGTQTFNDPATSNEYKINIFLHEVVHSLTVRQLNEYFEAGSGLSYNLKKDITIPATVLELNTVFSSGVKAVEAYFNKKGQLEQYKKIRELLDKRKDAPGTEATAIITKEIQDYLKNNNLSTDEFQLVYATTNIKEFYAIMPTDAFVYEIMNSTPYRASGQTIAQKFFGLLRRFVSSIFRDINTNTVAEQGLMSLFKFIGETKPVVNPQKKEAPKKSKAEEAREAFASIPPPVYQGPPVDPSELGFEPARPEDIDIGEATPMTPDDPNFVPPEGGEELFIDIKERHPVVQEKLDALWDKYGDSINQNFKEMGMEPITRETLEQIAEMADSISQAEEYIKKCWTKG